MRYLLFVFAILIFFAFFFLSSNEPSSEVKEMHVLIESQIKTLLHGEEQYFSEEVIIPEDMFISEIIPVVKSGENILHHVILWYDGASDDYYICPQEKSNLALFTSGAELISLSLPSPYGFFLEKGKKLSMEVHLANEKGKMVQTALAVNLSGRKEGKPVKPLHIVAGVVAKGPCQGGNARLLWYDIPQGITSHVASLAQEFIMQRTGKLVYWSGHIHDYGESIELSRNNDVVDTLYPKDDPGVIHKNGIYVGGKHFSSPLVFNKGDALNIKALYRKPSDIGIKGAMGIGYLVFDYSP